GVHAREGLRLHVVLFQCHADGVLVFRPVPLARVRVAPVVLGETNFAKAQLTRLAANSVGHVLAGRGAGGLEVPRDRRGVDEWLADVVVSLAVFAHLRAVDSPDPLPIGGFLDVLGLLGIRAAVEAQVGLPEGNTRDGGEILGHRDLHVRIAKPSTRPCDNVIYLFFHGDSSSTASSRVSELAHSLTEARTGVKGAIVVEFGGSSRAARPLGVRIPRPPPTYATSSEALSCHRVPSALDQLNPPAPDSSLLVHADGVVAPTVERDLD